MTTALLAALILINAGYLVLLDRRDRRDREERDKLMQRVQAPREAVMERQVSTEPDKPAVNPFNEEEFWQAKEEEQQALARMAELQARMP